MTRRRTMSDFSLDDFLANVRDDGFGCLVWMGYAQAGRYPQWQINGFNSPARRLIYQAVHGRIRRGQQVGVTCGCELCVHPDHLVARSKSLAAPHQPLAPLHRLISTQRRRAKAKIDMDIARSIRASTEPSTALAQRYGIPRGHVWRIRTGRAWVETTSPWAGLGAI